jgi:hypothetical protein
MSPPTCNEPRSCRSRSPQQCRGALVAGLAVEGGAGAFSLILVPFFGTYGQDAPVTPPANPDLQEKIVPGAQITVTAEVLKQRVDTYISKVSGGHVNTDDHPMARWREPICPLIARLPPEDGQFVFDRLNE